MCRASWTSQWRSTLRRAARVVELNKELAFIADEIARLEREWEPAAAALERLQAAEGAA